MNGRIESQASVSVDRWRSPAGPESIAGVQLRSWGFAMPLRYPLAARVASAAASDFTSDAGTGTPMFEVSTSASINGPVM